MILKKLPLRLIYSVIILSLSSCYCLNSSEFERKDVVGFYETMNSANANKQYIEILDNGFYYNHFCVDDSIVVIKNNKWYFAKGTESVRLDNMLYPKDTSSGKGSYHFRFNYKTILSLGEDQMSFKKVWFKPNLNCEY